MSYVRRRIYKEVPCDIVYNEAIEVFKSFKVKDKDMIVDKENRTIIGRCGKIHELTVLVSERGKDVEVNAHSGYTATGEYFRELLWGYVNLELLNEFLSRLDKRIELYKSKPTKSLI